MGKILHISLNEYEDLRALQSAFVGLRHTEENLSIVITASKNDAEERLQQEWYKTDKSRIFWYKKENFEDSITYVMYEAVFD